MWLINLWKLSFKQLRRHWLRTILTILGTVSGLFLFFTVETLQQSLKEATEIQADDDTLVVYRDKRFCPFTSRLPEDYGRKISLIAGVKSVTPIKIVVNNCGTSLDSVTFRGIPKEKIGDFLAKTNLSEEAKQRWQSASDSAILGRQLYDHRRQSVGGKLDAAGITVRVAGVIDSENPQDLNVAYVHLDFIQKASKHGLGLVTQFNVKVDDSKNFGAISKQIDETFRYDREPTHTRPEKAFIAQTGKDMVELIGFTRWLGIAAVMAVLFLVSNTIILTVRGRIKEYAVMQVLGFRSEQLAWLTLAEGLTVGLIGGILSASLAYLTFSFGHFAISADGLSIVFSMHNSLLVKGIFISLILGIFAGIYPAYMALNGSLVHKLRDV
jgi:putative ABC transport system permease protein